MTIWALQLGILFQVCFGWAGIGWLWGPMEADKPGKVEEADWEGGLNSSWRSLGFVFWCVLFFFFFFFCFLGPHLRHMEVPRLGVQLELQLPAYTTATATLVPRRVWDLYHSSRQCQILNPLSEARDRTRNLMVSSQFRFCCAMMGAPGCCLDILLPNNQYAIQWLPYQLPDNR